MAPQNKYITLGGHRHRYQEAGSNDRTMLLLHGVSSSLDFYEQVIPSLAGSFRVLALDLLGFGGSEKPAGKDYSLQLYSDLIYEFLEKTGSIDGEHLYATGHSMGGKYLLATALDHPSTFDKLVLSNTDGFTSLPSWGRFLSLPGVRHILKPLVTGERIAGKMLSVAFHDPETVDRESYRKILEVARDRDAFETVMGLNRNLKKLDMNRTGLRARLGELTMPVLIIWGDRDRYVDPEIAEIVQKELPCAKLVMFNECGHSPMLEYPEKFSATIRDFIVQEHLSSENTCL